MEAQRIALAHSSSYRLRELLKSHPFVETVETGETLLEFRIGSDQKEVRIGDISVPVRGLIEAVDNNPIVCATVFSLPDPCSALAIAALSPVIEAGLVESPPEFEASIPGDSAAINAFLAGHGWQDGVIFKSRLSSSESLATATATVRLQEPLNQDEIAGLYEERFGRSFYIRPVADLADLRKALHSPYLYYRLTFPGQATIQIDVAADLHGKLGETAVIQAMNIMCGYEECDGIPNHIG